ncbi:MAG: GxxExxY protein [Bacteroidetes bacterium]|nr:GxxExxY protein [Bacteroidota bacterium]
MDLNGISRKVIGCGIEVHKQLGPGLLESTYEHCLAYELQLSGIHVERQKVLPVLYKDVHLDCGYRLDLLVEGELIVELKAVDKLLPIHEAQVLTYLKLSQKRLGLLMNFNEKLLMNGVRRLVNNFIE